MELARQVLLAFAIILAAGIAFGALARRLRVPDVAIRADSALNQLILVFGASYILFDGGAARRGLTGVAFAGI